MVFITIPFNISRIKGYYKAVIVELFIFTDCYVCSEYQNNVQAQLNADKETENLNNKHQLLQEDKRRKRSEGSTSSRYRLLESRIDILEKCMANIVRLYQESENQQAQEIEIVSTLSQNTAKLRDRVNMLEKRFSQAIQDFKHKNKKEHKIIAANFKNITRSTDNMKKHLEKQDKHLQDVIPNEAMPKFQETMLDLVNNCQKKIANLESKCRSLELSNKILKKYYTQLAPRSDLDKPNEELGNTASTSAKPDKKSKVEQKAFISEERFRKYEPLVMLSQDSTNHINEVSMDSTQKDLSNAVPLVSGLSNLVSPSYLNDTSNSASDHKDRCKADSIKNHQYCVLKAF